MNLINRINGIFQSFLIAKVLPPVHAGQHAQFEEAAETLVEEAKTNALLLMGTEAKHSF